MTDPTRSGIDPGDPLAPGATFAGHRIEAVIGSGGMGVVHRARNLMLQHERALKVIAPVLSADERFQERFRREARLAASVDHPNVIPVHDAGEEEGRLYLAMRLVEGPDLRRLVEADGPLEPSRAARLLVQLAAGLDAAHARGLVHRDVKPSNVLVESLSGGERAFVGDFGLSRSASAGETLTATGEFFGSADYISPEQIEGGEVDQRSDVYALGGVLHYMLTGKPPFVRDSDLAKLFAHANTPPPRPSEHVSGLPPAVDSIVGRAMGKRPEDRYQSAGELASEAGDALGGHAVPTPPAAGRTRGRGRYVFAAGAALALLGAAAVAALVLAGNDDETPTRTPPPPAAGRVVDTIKVGRTPTGVAVGEINVWVASSGARAIYAIDPGTNKLFRKPVSVEGRPNSVAVGFGSIWASVGDTDSVVKLDPAEGTAPVTIPVGDNPTAIATGQNWVWVANEGSDTVSRIDPNTSAVSATVEVGDAPSSVATGAGAVWVGCEGEETVSKIVHDLAETVGTAALDGAPTGLAVDRGPVWVTDGSNDTLTPIDAESLRVGPPIDVGSEPRGVTTGFGYVWVANAGDGTVDRVDPKTERRAGSSVRVGAAPAEISAGKDALWVANEGSADVTRIKPARPR
jgi:YVTN family beta-propeller protein